MALPQTQVNSPANIPDARHADEGSNAIPEVSGSGVTVQLVGTVVKQSRQEVRRFRHIVEIDAPRRQHDKRRKEDCQKVLEDQ